VQIRTTLRNKLISTYRAILDAAPKAKIVVVGYPNVISHGLTATARCAWTMKKQPDGPQADGGKPGLSHPFHRGGHVPER
jgi:hypothetical protein